MPYTALIVFILLSLSQPSFGGNTPTFSPSKHQQQVRKALHNRHKISKLKARQADPNCTGNKLKIKQKIEKEAKIYFRQLDKSKQHRPIKTIKPLKRTKQSVSTKEKVRSALPPITHNPQPKATDNNIIPAKVADFSESIEEIDWPEIV